MSHHRAPLRFSSSGVRGLQVSATLSVNERVRELWSSGATVYHLGFGESRFPVHPRIAAALAANAHRRSYLPTLGLPELRAAVAAHYRRRHELDVSPEQIVIGPGSKSLIYACLLALGEEVVIPEPSWVTYGPQAHLVRKSVTWVPTRPEQRYQIDLTLLKERMAESRRTWGNPEVLITNSPGNPTGTMTRPAEVEALAGFARSHSLALLSDEIYALTAHGTVPHVSPARFYPEGTVVLGGLSKSLSLGGWRVGTAVLPPGPDGASLARAIQNIASNVWSCVTAPVQYAALVAYGDPVIDAYVDLCSRIHRARTQHLHRILEALGIPCPQPEGGFYVFPCFEPWRGPLAQRGISSDVDLAAHLLEHYRIASLPGSAFHSSQRLCLRLSSSFLDAETDAKAQALVDAFQADPDPDRFIQDFHPSFRDVRQRLADFVGDLGKP